MKYFIVFSLAFVFAFTGFVGNTQAASCGSIDPITFQVVSCGNGPIVAQLPGGRFLKPAQEDCPWWFPYAGCYTMRPVGAVFIPLQ